VQRGGVALRTQMEKGFQVPSGEVGRRRKKREGGVAWGKKSRAKRGAD